MAFGLGSLTGLLPWDKMYEAGSKEGSPIFEKLDEEMEEIVTNPLGALLPGGLFDNDILEKGMERGEEALEGGRVASQEALEQYRALGGQGFEQQAGNVLTGMYDTPGYQGVDTRLGTPQTISNLSFEDYQMSPEYQVKMQQAQKAIDRMGAGGRIPGGYSGSASLDRLLQSSQDIGTQGYQAANTAHLGLQQQNLQNLLNVESENYNRDIYGAGKEWETGRTGVQDQYNILQGLADVGQQAAGTAANIETGYGRDISNLYTDLASAKAGMKAQQMQMLSNVAGAGLGALFG